MQPIVWIKAHESVILVILVFASILIGFYVLIKKRSQSLVDSSAQQGTVAGATYAAQSSPDNSLQYIPTVETWAIDNGTSGPITTTGSGPAEAGSPVTVQSPLNPPVNSAPVQQGSPPTNTQVAVPLAIPDSGARTTPTPIAQVVTSDVRVNNPIAPIVQSPPVTGTPITSLPVVSLPIAPITPVVVAPAVPSTPVVVAPAAPSAPVVVAPASPSGPVVTPPHIIASSSTPIATPPHIIVSPTPTTPIKSVPVTTPKKASVQWVQHYSSNNQTLNSIAHNATVSIAADMKKAGSTQTTTVTGQQIYNQNKSVIDAAWIKKYNGRKGKTPSLDDPTYVTGVPIIIPKVVFS